MTNWPDLLKSAQALQRAGRFTEAEGVFQQALAVAPQEAAVHHLFGLLRLQQKRLEDAEGLLRSACERTPHPPEALLHHALSLAGLGRSMEALNVLDQLLSSKTDAAGAWNNRAEILVSLGRLNEALEDFERAIAINPRFAHAIEGKGSILLSLGRFPEALASFDRALAIQPHAVAALLGRGRALLGLHRPGEAVPVLDLALSFAPNNSDAWFRRGIALDDLGYFEDAIRSYDRAIVIRPEGLGSRNNRSAVLQRLRRFKEAAEGYEGILAQAPNDDMALNGLANCALYSCSWQDTENFMQRMRTRIEGGAVAQLGTVLGYFSDPALHLAAARNYIRHHWPTAKPPLWRGPHFDGKRIRLAYCSANFNSHPMPRLLAGMFEHHDRENFEVLAFSFGPDDQSDIRRRLIRSFDQFHDVASKSDADISQQIADLGVDIAIDLMGHTNGARTAIFAARPAPVQVNYMGFPGTLGADFYDYILGDAITLPVAHQPFYPERIVQLPDSYLANDDKRSVPHTPPSRAEAGLPDQSFVFCCFNNNWKITASMFAVWVRLLRQVPASVLWLLEDNEDAVGNLRAKAKTDGIDPSRLVFAARTTPEAHLTRHCLADLFLDTLPYNAHTTASDSLWVGVPLITLSGAAFHSRVAASALSAVGLSELIVSNLQEYESVALKLARNPVELAQLRQKLIRNRSQAPLFDTVRSTRNIEGAYRHMASIFREGGKPQGFAITHDNSVRDGR